MSPPRPPACPCRPQQLAHGCLQLRGPVFVILNASHQPLLSPDGDGRPGRPWPPLCPPPPSAWAAPSPLPQLGLPPSLPQLGLPPPPPLPQLGLPGPSFLSLSCPLLPPSAWFCRDGGDSVGRWSMRHATALPGGGGGTRGVGSSGASRQMFRNVYCIELQ